MRIRKTIMPAAITIAALSVAASAVAQDQETDIPGVTARLLFVTHDGSTTTIAIVLRNSTSQDGQATAGLQFAKFTLAETAGGKKHFPLKDQNGHYLAGPIANWNNGGTWYPFVPAQGTRTLFAVFERLPAGAKVSIQVPMLPPFDDVDLAAMAGQPAAAAGMPHGAIAGEVVAATRANAQLRVRMKVTRAATGYVDPAAIKYADVSVLDPRTRRQYWLLKDTDGNFSAQPMTNTNDGGSFFLRTVPERGQVFINLGFTPPPDAVTHVLLMVPFFLPVPVDLQGTTGAAETGTSASGRTIGLEKALSDLKAAVTPDRITINLSADVLFDFDKADLKADAEASLAQVVTVIKAYPEATIDIGGHTDGKGTDAYNQPLSERRAAAVARWLAERAGVDPSRFHTTGFGKTQPIAPNTKPDGSDDPGGRATNRRVEIIVNRKA